MPAPAQYGLGRNLSLLRACVALHCKEFIPMDDHSDNCPVPNSELGPDDFLSDERPAPGDPSPRASIELKKRLLRDILGAVVDGSLTSVQITGPAGMGKSRLCQQYLRSRGVKVVECPGYLTTAKAVEKLRTKRNGVFLFDDTYGCAQDPKFIHILLEATGPANPKTGQRAVHYETAKGTKAFNFSGRFIFVSNVMFSGAPRAILEALNSRLVIHRYELTTDEAATEIYSIAKAGVGAVNAKDAMLVATQLIRECEDAGVTPSIRMFVDQAIPIYTSCRNGGMECSWEQHLAVLVQKGTTDSLSSRARTPEEREAERRLRIVERIVAEYPAGPLQVQAWDAATGMSPATFYRYRRRLTDGDNAPHAA